MAVAMKLLRGKEDFVDDGKEGDENLVMIVEKVVLMMKKRPEFDNWKSQEEREGIDGKNMVCDGKEGGENGGG